MSNLLKAKGVVILDDVTYCATTCGSMSALNLAVASVLNATALPARIVIRFEGEFPSFSDFVLEQLVALATNYGVHFTFHVGNGGGIRAARQFLLDNCVTHYCWMGDDDVLMDYDCLYKFAMAIPSIELSGKVALLGGVKVDVNNRRGYKDYSLEPVLFEEVSQNHFYDKAQAHGKTLEQTTLGKFDTGNCLIDANLVKSAGISFLAHGNGPLTCGAEDALFQVQCAKKGLRCVVVPSAQAWHLEKKVVRFSQEGARTALVNEWLKV